MKCIFLIDGFNFYHSITNKRHKLPKKSGGLTTESIAASLLNKMTQFRIYIILQLKPSLEMKNL